MLPIQKSSASSEPSALSLSLAYSGDLAHHFGGQRGEVGNTVFSGPSMSQLVPRNARASLCHISNSTSANLATVSATSLTAPPLISASLAQRARLLRLYFQLKILESANPTTVSATNLDIPC